jgi:hypothetical protein
MARDEDHLARLTSVRTELEAGIIVGGLESRGIPATMSGVYTANFRAEAPGWVEVLVAEDDLSKAESALEEVRQERGDVDWSQIDVGEPEEAAEVDTAPWRDSALVRSLGYVVGVVVLVGVAALLIVRLASILGGGR